MLELHSPGEAAQWLHGRVTGTLQCDSRKVGAGDGFIAWPGAATDGRRHVQAALAQGGTACLVEREGVEAFAFDQPAIAAYPQLKAACGPIAAAYFEAPSERLDVLAITGTNGKTSTAWWLAQALSNLAPDAAGDSPYACGLIGTLGTGRPPVVEFTGLTTPDPVLLQGQFRRFLDQGLKACAIEASSVGIVERRLDGTRIRVAVFTNFTQDHLDYHGSMEAYWEAKAQLFRWPGLRAAVVNVDDEKGQELAAVAARRRAGPVDRVVRAGGPAGRASHPIRRAGAALHAVRGRRAPRTRDPADRPVQRRQPARRDRRDARGRGNPGRRRGGLRRAFAGAGPDGPVERSRQAVGGGGLCPHAGRAGQGLAGAATAGRSSAAASCGACSAAAASAMRPSGR